MRVVPLLVLGALATACAESPVSPTIPLDPAFSQGQGVEEASAHAMRWYDVTITNLTTGQPLSPGVVATHTKRVGLFNLGQPASEGIRQIAENGDPSAAVATLAGTEGVAEVLATTAPIGVVGGTAFPASLTVRIGARANANHLSLAVMLICTNDGFAGLSAVRLPGGFRPETWYLPAYDAGTEANTEADGDIVPPCFGLGPVGGMGGGGRTQEVGVVSRHPGIVGGAALVPVLHGWTGAIAKVTVRRVQ